MGKFIDLNLLIDEPLKIKGLDNQVYNIPAEISTKFYLKLMNYEEKFRKTQNPEEQLAMMKQMVLEILNLDPEKDITMEYFEQHFDSIKFMQKILEGFTEHIQGQLNNPNFTSPTAVKQPAGDKPKIKKSN